MEIKDLFKKYRSRLTYEGIFKSFLIGLIVMCAINIPLALITSAHYFTQIFELWYLVALGIGLTLGLSTALICYFTLFKPNTIAIARRIDKLGLEERAITMLELKKDESYIAMRQREDAKAKIKDINSKSIKFAIAKPLIIITLVIGILSILTTTANVLATYNIIEPPPILEPKKEIVTVEYKVFNEIGGRIEGANILYKIEKGTGTTFPVCAIADEEYEFVYWIDETGNLLSKYPERQENLVNKNTIIYAVFEQLDITDEKDPAQSYDPYAYPKPDEIGDKPEPPNDIDTPDNPNPQWSPNNQIKDNNTSYYGDYEIEKEDAIEQLVNDSTLSNKQKEAINSYYDQLNPPKD